MPRKFNSIIKELRESLDGVTLKELANDSGIQKSLIELRTTINEFFALINPKNRGMVIATKRSHKTGGKDGTTK